MPFWLSVVFLAISVCALILTAVFLHSKALKVVFLFAWGTAILFFAGYAALTVLLTDVFPAPHQNVDDAILAEAHERADPYILRAKEEMALLPMAAEDSGEPEPYLSFSFVPPCAYDTLTDTQKALYDEVLPKIAAIEDFTYRADEYGYDTLNDLLLVSTAIDEDHPEYEIYYQIVDVIADDERTTESLRSYYYMPADSSAEITTPEEKDALRHELAVFDAVCDLVAAAIPEDATTYDKYRFLASYITLVTDYDDDFMGGIQIGTAYGAILGGRSICEGYSVGFRYLCQKADLWCELVTGLAGDMSHAWNLVRVSNGTYHVDVTWSDSGYTPGTHGWYNYFMLSQGAIVADHVITDGTMATGKLYPKPFPVYG